MKKIILSLITLELVLGFASAEVTQTTVTSEVTKTEVIQKDQSPDEKAQAVEIVRRQELVFRAQKAIEEGQKSEALGEYSKAQERYRFALVNLGVKSDETQLVVASAGEGLARVNYRLAIQAIREQKWDTAQKLLEEAQAADQNNQQVDELLIKVKKSAADPKLAGELVNPAVTPRFLENVKKTDEWLIVSEQYAKTGQYDEAIATQKKILAIDPYNKSALEGIAKISDEKARYYRLAQDQTREKRLLEAESKWSVQQKQKIEGKTEEITQTVLVKSNKFGINEKLKTIILPELNFRGASIVDAANFLSSKSRELDKKDKKGIQIIVQEDAKRNAKEVNLSLKNIPLLEALRYVCRVSDVKFKVEEFAIVV
ncbi:MAG: hypothetical protein V4507_07330, partial [Verrucomicrobiota bacterium]